MKTTQYSQRVDKILVYRKPSVFTSIYKLITDLVYHVVEVANEITSNKGETSTTNARHGNGVTTTRSDRATFC